MTEKKSGHTPFREAENKIDMFTVLQDILQHWMSILLLSVSAALLVSVAAAKRYQPEYTASATMFVTGGGIASTIYDNQYSAETMASRFEQLLNSHVLQKKVAKEAGLSEFTGKAHAAVIPETNLITLTVTADSPGLCFKLIHSIMQNYDTVSDYVLGDTILETLQAPSIPVAPDNPLDLGDYRKKAFLLMAVFLCVVFGLFSYLRDTIRSEKDIAKKLDARRLGTLWHENKYKTLGSWIRRNKSSILITNPTVSFRYVESVKKLSRRVKNRMDEKEAKVLMVTSVLENEGKSTVAANISLALSQETSRVLLIDCDLRKPSQYKVLNMQNTKMDDLGEVLNGKGFSHDLVHKVPGTNLYAILNTIAFDHSAEMITAGMLKQILSYFREKMDYIIIDTPPLAMAADAEELVEMADASLLVIREHNVETKDLNDAIDTLNGAGKKNIGCVFNNAHMGFTRKMEGYGYGYGYGYGGHYEQRSRSTGE